MSHVLIPPQRSSENLIYLILPLSLALLIVVALVPDLYNPTWLVFVAFFTSTGALVLYLGEPDVIYHRHQLRKELKKEGTVKNLRDNFSTWSSLAEEWNIPCHNIARYVDTLGSNAVACSFINRRMFKLRAMDNFLWSFFPYLISGSIIYYRLERFELTNPFFILGISAAALTFSALMYVRDRRIVYKANLLSLIEYITEYSFTRLLFGIDQLRLTPPETHSFVNTILKELEYFDRLLSRGNLDVFSTLWGNTRDWLTHLSRESLKQ